MIKLDKANSGVYMPEELFVQHCSPTLAGIKTANLFTTKEENRETLLHQIAVLNDRFAKSGLGIMVLGKTKKDRHLIYVYRMKKLKEDIHDPCTNQILSSLGYDTEDIGKCLTTLIHRMKEEDTFPHEIGCFLGYPASDVKGFMDKDKPYKAFGVWQVYDNVEETLQLFSQYDVCTKEYLNRYESGTPLEYLTVKI